MLREKPSAALVITNDERNKLAHFVRLLIAVDRRLQNKEKSRRKEKIRLACKRALFLLRTTLYLSYLSQHLKVVVMIDTVILVLPKDMFQITDPEAFKPSAKWVEKSRTITGLHSKQNPTKKDLRGGIYKPRLTLTNRATSKSGPELILKIELSLPKLLFGNNFAELSRKDFKSLTQKLAVTLESMGISTSADKLAQTDISVIHYSKNIPLTDGSIPYQYINKIKESNAQLSLDISKTEYRNGHSFKWHCNSYEVVFYDKIKDLETSIKSSKRALEKDNDLQLHLFDRLKTRKKLEFLRMEVRLNKRQKVKSLFKKLGIKSDLTFNSLFKAATAKKVLLHYLDDLENKRPLILDYHPPSDRALLAAMVVNNPKISNKHILQIFGFKKALESSDARELRLILARFSNRSWYRLMADVNKIQLPSINRPLDVVRECIYKFKPLKLNSALPG